MAEEMADVVAGLLFAHRHATPEAVLKILRGPVVDALEATTPGLGDLHLTLAFARLLAAECPPHGRDEHGIPLLSTLVGDVDEHLDLFETYVTRGDRDGRLGNPADVKAARARVEAALPLAQRFMTAFVAGGDAVRRYPHLEDRRSPTPLDDLWGVLFRACANACLPRAHS